MSGNEILEAAHVFAKEIKETDVYRNYDYQKNKLKEQPELFQRVCEYRKKNYQIQNMEDEGSLLDRLEDFEKEYASFREIPLVEDFLSSELAFCRMMQEINMILTTDLDFE